MGGRLKYDNTRLFFASLFFFGLYAVVLPGNWPTPRVEVEHAASVPRAQDLPLEVTVKAWHPNFSVRQVSFAVNNVNSSALAPGKTLVPLNLYSEKKVKEWEVGFRKRMTWPRKTTLRLEVPLERLTREGTLGRGELQGTFDVTLDYTKVTMKSGYPPLSVRRQIPYSIRLGP
jgi:hypothetical protein